jgi:hypothetical protein
LLIIALLTIEGLVYLFIEEKKCPVFVVPEWNKILPQIPLINFPAPHQSKATNKRMIKKGVGKKEGYKCAAMDVVKFCA